MIIDGLLQFDPALSAITVTRASINTIDLLNARDIGGPSNPAMWLYVGVNAAFTAGGAATLVIQMQNSVDNSTWVTEGETRALSISDLTPINRVMIASWPMRLASDALPRYLRLNYVVATGPMTAGSVNAQLVLDPQAYGQYPAGINITN
jgi:hypothetical protein